MWRKATPLFCLIVVSCLGVPVAQGQTLWGYYPINENDFNDYSGNDHHGTPVDGAATVFDAERGWVAAFNAQPELPSRVLCGTDDPSAGGELTVAAWLKWDGLNGNWQGIAGKSFSYEDRQWILQLRDTDGNIQWGGPDNASLHIWSDVAPAMNEWQHVAGTCDGSTSKVYFDGELVGEGPGGFVAGSAAAANVTLGFGEDRDDYDESFNGALDEIYILTRALSGGQVKDLAGGILPAFDTAREPYPADGETAVTVPLFQWTAGDGARFHDVYFGTDPNLGPDDLVQPRTPMAMYYHVPGLIPGTTYYWRVDEIEADMTTIHTGDVWTFIAQPQTAYLPDPADGANDASGDPNVALTWLVGIGAARHHVYFGETFDDVNEGAPGVDKGILDDPIYSPGALPPLTSYYWRVDEIGAGDTVTAGQVWSFTTFSGVDDFESYTDDMEAGEAIFQTWIDGLENGTGSYVGYEVSANGTFGETSIVHGGNQSMPLDYNNVDVPHYSETSRTWAAPLDWTVKEADALVLWVRGGLNNDVEPLYVAVEDSVGRIGLVAHPDPEVATAVGWTEWQVPLSELSAAGVNVAAVKKMVIGVGDRNAPTPGGAGVIYIDDIRVTRPAPAAGSE